MSEQRFRKKPVVIDAWPARDLIHAAGHNWRALPAPVADAYENGMVVFTPNAIHVRTLEGVMVAGLDDMVIRGVKGEFYPCRAEIFEATYEPEEGE